MYNNNFGNINDLFEEFGKVFENVTAEQDLDFDVIENENYFVLFVDTPGYNKEDLKLQFEDNKLTITIPERESNGTVLKERSRKESKRSYEFKGVDKTSIKANLENGVLKVTLGKLPKEESVIIVE